MKKLQLSLLAVLSLLLLSFSANAKKVKPINENAKKEIVLDVAQFGKYLNDGHPHAAEGVYTTEDGRYVIAIIKDEEKSHDFIGVVISADNQYWSDGEVKFNFVLNGSGSLEGLYYNSNGESFPMEFQISENGIESDMLKKVDVEVLRNEGLAFITGSISSL